MTCIVGLKSNNKVFIGGDSLGSDSSFNKALRSDDKVFAKGEMIFGFTTSYRMGQILRYSFNIPSIEEGMGNMEYLVGKFIPELIEAYEKGGFLQKSTKGQYQGGDFLLGFRGELYNIQSDFQVGYDSRGYSACGCGDAYALGSMYSTRESTLSPEERITLALNAAEYHSAGVSSPYIIVSI